MVRSRVTLAVIVLATSAAAQEHQHGAAAGEQLGTVRFTTSCKPDVQQPFNRAVALLHSFDFGKAIEGFNAVLTADPACAIAHWGIALSRWGNPFAAGLKPAAQLQQGRDAIGRAAAIQTTARERAYIDAAARLFADVEQRPQADRVRAYRDAMADVAARYPDDVEAAIFYALPLAFAADPADKTYVDQLKAGAILDKLFTAQPNHPGLAHYIIHTYDVPPLANRALEAALRDVAGAEAAGRRVEGVRGDARQGAESLPRAGRRGPRGVAHRRPDPRAQVLPAAAQDLREGRQAGSTGNRVSQALSLTTIGL
jgi:hypothetical protein